MQKLFLSSLFKDVFQIFIDFANENLVGKTVTFIPTAAIPDKLDFHIRYSKELLAKMGLIVYELEISTASHSDIVKKLENNEYIYVAGGNTFFLLQEMNRTGTGNLIKTQINT
jgi:dipeptidase E